MFFIPKSDDEVWLIFNFKKLSKTLKVPTVFLPSLFQIIKKYKWPRNLLWTKLDIKQAFFNINVHKKSKDILTIKVNGRYYHLNFLPFCIGIAPFVFQLMLTCVLRFIRRILTLCYISKRKTCK